jgi:hypothetical protein
MLLLQWNSEDGFIYIPDPNDPLIYSRPGKPAIPLERMFTDGGSIPRVFWSVPGFSPWAYGPAYILHDWLYNAHRCCHLPPPPAGYDEAGANEVLYDAIGILVQQGKADGHGEARNLIKWAVDTYGAAAWNGACTPTPLRTLRAKTSVTIERISLH